MSLARPGHVIQKYLTVKHANGLVFDMFGEKMGNHYTIKHDSLTLKEQRLSLSGVVSTSLVIQPLPLHISESHSS